MVWNVYKVYRGIWLDANEIQPSKKGWYLTWVENTHNIQLERTYWDGLFWELTRYGKARGYKVTYWTKELPYPEEM